VIYKRRDEARRNTEDETRRDVRKEAERQEKDKIHKGNITEQSFEVHANL